MLTLNDGRSELWQWDTKRKLTVDADCTQVHFSNKVFGRSIDVDVVDGVAIIPDILLQTDKDLTAWAFVGTPENGYTKISKVFKVNKRNKPADYVFTPPEQTTLQELVERLDAIEESQDPDAIKNAVEDYLEQNPVEAPVQSVNGKTGGVELTAEDVGAISQDKLQEVTNKALAQAKASGEFDGLDGKSAYQIAVDNGFEGSEAEWLESLKGGGGGTSVSDAVLYTEQELTTEQQEQARKNIGAMPANAVISLTSEQINALDALFKAASYTEDVSFVYAAFCDAFGLVNPGEPDEPDNPDAPSVKQGTVSFENGRMVLTGATNYRGTLLPIGQYLEKGVTYKFSLGDIASTYVYGVQVFVADSPALKFPHAYENVTYDGITERLVDSGWITNYYAYTPDKDNCILAVNFRKKDYTQMNDSDYDLLFESFTIEEMLPNDAVNEIKKGTMSFGSDHVFSLNGAATDRATLVPIGRYLEKGKTYRFSIGNIANSYYYGVQILVAESAGMEFSYVADVVTNYSGVTEKLVDTGWMQNDYTYTPDRDNCILTVNFKGNPVIDFDDSNYAEILENFIFEEVVQ